MGVFHSKKGNYLGDKAKSEGASVMVSYDRKDKTFAKNLVDALANPQDERDIWVDWEDMEPSHDWLDEIHKGIEKSDVFIYILSPDSIKAPVCKYEVDHALKNGKKIIAVSCRDVDYSLVRKEISSLNWIFFREDNNNSDNFRKASSILIKELDEDLRHAHCHTMLLVRAIDWEKHDFEKSLLLTGTDLRRANNWLSASALGKMPKPTTLHLSFITASDSLSKSMYKRKMIALFFFFIVAIGIKWPSWGVFFFSLIFSHFFVYFSSN